MRKILLLAFTVITVTAYAQQNGLEYTPANPKPGETITFTYTPSNDLAGSIIPVEVAVYQLGKKGKRKADDLSVKRVGTKFTGSFTTDTAMNFVYLGFSIAKKFDNNANQGYQIFLTENDKPREGAYASQSLFYQYLGEGVGVESNPDKALASYEKEVTEFPASKRDHLLSVTRLRAQQKPEEASKIYQKEIEGLLKAGLKEEADYTAVQSLYNMAKLPEQSKMVLALKKEKFPNGNWLVDDEVEKLVSEKDIDKKKELQAALVAKVESGDAKYANLKQSLWYYQSLVARAYMAKKDWDNFKTALETSGMPKSNMASLYNSVAWQLQEAEERLDLARIFAERATQFAKEEWKTPAGPKPEHLTGKQWTKNSQYTYAMYADTYGMVAYRQKDYKKGLVVAKEAAITLNEGRDAEQNQTYALLAEKALPASKYVKELEGFVKAGTSTAQMQDILKRAYVKSKKSEAGFDEYISAMQKESQVKMLEELRKSMIDETAPSFALYNLEGKKVDISDLKGKVVVVDFWATWCGPCKASFPGMQKAVTKYKDDPNVKFIFVDTWEQEEDKQKNASDFITKNKYSFDVWMDNEDKVVSQFKVDGIPTKFVIDKEGKIRFKTVGFDGSDDKLVMELTAMIEMAGNPEKKAF